MPLTKPQRTKLECLAGQRRLSIHSVAIALRTDETSARSILTAFWEEKRQKRDVDSRRSLASQNYFTPNADRRPAR